jgi:hypothetical protein
MQHGVAFAHTGQRERRQHHEVGDGATHREHPDHQNRAHAGTVEGLRRGEVARDAVDEHEEQRPGRPDAEPEAQRGCQHGHHNQRDHARRDVARGRDSHRGARD